MATEHDRAILSSIFYPTLPLGESMVEEELPENLKDDEGSVENIEDVKHLEIDGVKAAENGDTDKALSIFSRVINIAPRWASGYNNRAQVYRLKGNIVAAISDLNEAVSLSGGRGRSGCQALCQRGIIHRKEGNDILARQDFEAAAKLGSQFAKMQLIELNPYAALCNQMLIDVMAKLNHTSQD